MQNNIIEKVLVFGIIILFIGASISSAISIETKTSIFNNQNRNYKLYIDPNIQLKRINLPILKKSLDDFRNSGYNDVEIEKLLEEIINLIEFKGEINSIDVENILIESEISSINIYTICKIAGHSHEGVAITFPLSFFTILEHIIIGIGGFLYWEANYPDYESPDIDITVGSTTYTNHHTGFAFGFFGVGTIRVLDWFDCILYIIGLASIVFVRT